MPGTPASANDQMQFRVAEDLANVIIHAEPLAHFEAIRIDREDDALAPTLKTWPSPARGDAAASGNVRPLGSTGAAYENGRLRTL